MDDWDEVLDSINGYNQPEETLVDQLFVNSSTTPVSGNNEQAIMEPMVEGSTATYSIEEKYRNAFAAAQSPAEFDAQVEMFKAELNAKQSDTWNLDTSINGNSLTGSALLNHITSNNFLLNPELTRSFIDTVQYNFETNIGPASIASVPSVLDDWELDNGLAPDEFGIDRKFRNGVMVPEDSDKVDVLQRAYDDGLKVRSMRCEAAKTMVLGAAARQIRNMQRRWYLGKEA